MIEPAKDKDIKTPSVGDGIIAPSARWTFGSNVANNFDSHVLRSVPLYESGHDLTVKLSDFFVKQESTIYELGSATGTLIRKLADRHKDFPDAMFIGLEKEPQMVTHAKKAHSLYSNLIFEECSVESFDFQKSDFITSHYTIQFVLPKFRQSVFDKIYDALEWGGGFVLFEKVRANDARFQDIFTTLYNEYKLDNGFDHAEILNKTFGLKGMMDPFTSDANVAYMRRAGFTDIISIQKYLCFEGWLAIK